MAVDLVESVIDKQQVRDELGDEPDATPLFTAYDDLFKVKHSISRFFTRDINTSFILDHTTNGVLDTSTLGDFRGANVLIRVVNPNNTFRELFLDDELKDVTTTATWNTTTHILTFTAGQFALSQEIALNQESYIRATLTAEGTSLANLIFKVSSNGGSTFNIVTNGAETVFTTPTTAGLKWRIEATGSATVTRITVTYSTV